MSDETGKQNQSTEKVNEAQPSPPDRQGQERQATGICPGAEYWYKHAKDETNLDPEDRLFYMENAYNHMMNALIATQATRSNEVGNNPPVSSGDAVEAIRARRAKVSSEGWIQVVEEGQRVIRGNYLDDSGTKDCEVAVVHSLEDGEFIASAPTDIDTLLAAYDAACERVVELERRLKIPFGKLPCAGCGGPHDFDTSVPSVVWNRVVRAQGLPEYLCTTCIVREFVRVGVSFTATLWNEEFNGVPIEVRVNGATANDATKIEVEAQIVVERQAHRDYLIRLQTEHEQQRASLIKERDDLVAQFELLDDPQGLYTEARTNLFNAAIDQAIGAVKAVPFHMNSSSYADALAALAALRQKGNSDGK